MRQLPSWALTRTAEPPGTRAHDFVHVHFGQGYLCSSGLLSRCCLRRILYTEPAVHTAYNSEVEAVRLSTPSASAMRHTVRRASCGCCRGAVHLLTPSSSTVRHAVACVVCKVICLLSLPTLTGHGLSIDRRYAYQLPPPPAAIRLMASCEPKCTLTPARANTEPTVPTTFSDSCRASCTPRAHPGENLASA